YPNIHTIIVTPQGIIDHEVKLSTGISPIRLLSMRDQLLKGVALYRILLNASSEDFELAQYCLHQLLLEGQSFHVKNNHKKSSLLPSCALLAPIRLTIATVTTNFDFQDKGGQSRHSLKL